MTTSLRYFMDDLLQDVPAGIASYGFDLANALVNTAPADCHVEAIIAKRSATQVEKLQRRIPNLSQVTQLRLPPKELKSALMRGHVGKLLPPGLVHSPTFLGPMYQRRRRSPFHQTVVTWHAALADTELPNTPTGKPSRATKSYLERIDQFADAVVVSTQAEAEMLAEFTHLGERIHIIQPAPSHKFVGAKPGAVAATVGIKTRYFLAYAPDQKSRNAVLSAVKKVAKPLPVILITDPHSNLEPIDTPRVKTISPTSDQLGALIARAAMVFYLAPADRKLLSVMDVMANNTPLAYLKSAQLDELTGSTGIAITPSQLTAPKVAELMDATARARKLPNQLRLGAADRIELFNWELTAKQIWQLHADL